MAAPGDRASGPKVWKVSGAMGGIAGASAIPYILDGGDGWKIGLLCGLAGVCFLVAVLWCPPIADRFWMAIARRVAPRLEGLGEQDATRGCARHLMTELGTIDRTVKEAIDNGRIWNTTPAAAPRRVRPRPPRPPGRQRAGGGRRRLAAARSSSTAARGLRRGVRRGRAGVATSSARNPMLSVCRHSASRRHGARRSRARGYLSRRR